MSTHVVGVDSAEMHFQRSGEFFPDEAVPPGPAAILQELFVWPEYAGTHLPAGTITNADRCPADRIAAQPQTERWDLLAALAALLRSLASAQSWSVSEVRPANVPGPASRCPPSMAMVSPVR
jgi:hypothetical protein